LTYFNTHLSPRFATSSQHNIRSSARYILAVKTSACCPCNVSPLKYWLSGPWPVSSFCSAWYRYALSAPGSTVMYPNTDSSGLSRILLILYSKFWLATSGLSRFTPHLPFIALISPQAPATFESVSNAFHRWYRLLPPGRVPTSSRMHTLGFSALPKALKNHRWEFSLRWLRSLRQKIIWHGTMPFSAPLNLRSASRLTCVVYSYTCALGLG